MPCPECDYTDRIIVRHKESTVGYELEKCKCSTEKGVEKKIVDKKAMDIAHSNKSKRGGNNEI